MAINFAKLINIIIIFIFLFFSCTSMAIEVPPNWPWRGIVVHYCCQEVNQKDVKALAEMGVNAIMLNINSRFRSKLYKISPDSSWEESILWVNELLNACKLYNLTCIVRINQLPLDPSKGITEKSPQFWQGDGWKEAVRVADELAKRLKDRGDEFGAYAVLTEPAIEIQGRAVKPRNWNKIQQVIIDTIRKSDKRRHIVVTPGPGGLPGNYKNFNKLDDPLTIYNSHMYVPHAFTHQGISLRKEGFSYPGIIRFKNWDKQRLAKTLLPLLDFQRRNNILVMIGEFSAVRYAQGGDQYLADLISLFEEYGWSWTYFSYKGTPYWDISDNQKIRKSWSPELIKAASISPKGRRKILKKAWHLNSIKINQK